MAVIFQGTFVSLLGNEREMVCNLKHKVRKSKDTAE